MSLLRLMGWVSLALTIVAGGCGFRSASSSALPATIETTGPSQVKQTSSCQPDFTFNISSTSATITNGQSIPIGFGMSSLCGLAGTINVGVRGILPQPTTMCKKVKGQEVCTSNGPLIHQCCYDFPLGAGGSSGNHITFSATSGTLKTTYTITIRGEDISGGCCYGLSHSAILSLTVD